MEKFIPYIGIEYSPDARQDNLVDCWGLVILLYKKLYNIELPSFESNSLSKDGINSTAKLILSNPLHNICTRVELEDVQEGDILILVNGGNPTHIGMAINNKEMLHAFDKVGSTIESFRSTKWQSRIKAVYRHPHFN